MSPSSKPPSADYGPYTLPREYPPNKGSQVNSQEPREGPASFQAAYLHQTVPQSQAPSQGIGPGLTLGQKPLPQGLGLLPGEAANPQVQTGPVSQTDVKPKVASTVNPQALASLSLQPGQPNAK